MTPSTQKNSKIVQTRIAKIWRDELGIMRAEYIPGAEDTLSDAIDFVAALKHFPEVPSSPAIVDLRNVKSSSSEARKYYAEESRNMASICAILIGSPITSVIANFFLKVNRPAIPIKIFTSEKAAVEWLKGYI